jgi:GTP cyclohydrolase I
VEDVQSQPDDRGVALDRVGIADLRYPIGVRTASGEVQRTVASMTISTGLAHGVRGTHMSRMVEAVHGWAEEISVMSVMRLAEHLAERLDALTADVEVSFPYAMEKIAPVSGLSSFACYDATFTAKKDNGTTNGTTGVSVPVTTVCPCSKAVSDYGAHNQRGTVLIEVRVNPRVIEPSVGIETLIEVAERSASAPVYPLVKRSDERFLTMQAFDHPVFVEDVARDVAVDLMTHEAISWFRVTVTNDESIHAHAAFAALEWSRPSAIPS